MVAGLLRGVGVVGGRGGSFWDRVVLGVVRRGIVVLGVCCVAFFFSFSRCSSMFLRSFDFLLYCFR